MRIIDVDAHLHEPLDWVQQTDGDLADELGPPARFMEIANSVFGISNPKLSALPDSQQPGKNEHEKAGWKSGSVDGSPHSTLLFPKRKTPV